MNINIRNILKFLYKKSGRKYTKILYLCLNVLFSLYVCIYICVCVYKDFIYLVLERGEEREKERVRNINHLPLTHVPTGDQTCNVGRCTAWESNQQIFTLLYDTQPTEPHWAGLSLSIFLKLL